MNHPDEQELVLYLSGDAADAAGLRDHLDSCAECSGQVRELEQLVAVASGHPVPEPDAEFEARIWEYQRRRLRSAPGGDRGRRWVPGVSWRRLGGVAAVAASLLAAFLLGRNTTPSLPPAVDERGQMGEVPPGPASDPDRVLLAAVSEQLRRSRLVLAELANVLPGDIVTVSLQQRRAHDLVASSRLYRQSARLRGRYELAGLLEEIERLLLDVARAPAGADEVESWQRRIRERDLLFKASAAELGTRATRPRPSA